MSEKLDKFKENYFSNRILEIYRFFTKEQLEILNKMEIKVENKKYSTFEFDEIQSKIILYYKDRKQLKEKGISDSEYESILEILDKISDKYNI